MATLERELHAIPPVEDAARHPDQITGTLPSIRALLGQAWMNIGPDGSMVYPLYAMSEQPAGASAESREAKKS